MELLKNDLDILKTRNISEPQIELQITQLNEGFPYLKLYSAASVGQGIALPSESMIERATNIWNQYLKTNPKVVKMVPASGAASRMFKNLFAFLDGKKSNPDDDFMKSFFNDIELFAFYPTLNATCMALYGKSVESLIKDKKYKDIVSALLLPDGMNYGKLPKALLEFHRAAGTARTALEEHFAEGAEYAASKNGDVNIHFTVSKEHIPLVENKIEEVRQFLQRLYGVNYHVSLSIQKPSTDTVAMDKNGQLVRDKAGNLLFRPGGHGALIENLNDIDADVVFIKNIDNVVPDAYRSETVKYKKVLGGVLVGLKMKIDEYCHILSKGTPDENKLEEMLDFLRRVLCITHDEADKMDADSKAAYIFAKLHRPLRVAGMVRNDGEPGGGPFLVYNADGTVSPQILESTQIDPKNKEYQKMLKRATHFNPVDLVCATKDFRGNKFHLPDFVDATTGFISSKSVEGVEIKALELPGLWNGAMSNWNTVFVEVPAETFNPVKTVNDLLRPAHQ